MQQMPLRPAPGTHCLSECNGCARRTVMNISGESFRCAMCFRLYFVLILGSFNSFKGEMGGAHFSLLGWCSFDGAGRGAQINEMAFPLTS